MAQSNEEEIVIMYFSAQNPIDGTTLFERKMPLTKQEKNELDFIHQINQ